MTPHIGTTVLFCYLPESERAARVVSPRGYTNRCLHESEEVLTLMAQLDDLKKIKVQAFDDKLIVVSAASGAFIGKPIGDDFQDLNFGSTGGPGATFKRLVHFLHGYLASESDAVIIVWKEKVKYELVRPTTIIKKLSTDLIIRAPGGIQSFPASNLRPTYASCHIPSMYLDRLACFRREKITSMVTCKQLACLRCFQLPFLLLALARAN